MLSVWFLLSYCLSNLISFWPPVCPRGFDVLLSEGFLSLIGFYVKDISLLSLLCFSAIAISLLSLIVFMLAISLLYLIGSIVISSCYCYLIAIFYWFRSLLPEGLLISLLSLDPMLLSLLLLFGISILIGFSWCPVLLSLLCYCHCYCHLVSLIGSYLIDISIVIVAISIVSYHSHLVNATAIHYNSTTIHAIHCYSMACIHCHSLIPSTVSPLAWKHNQWWDSHGNKGKKRSVIANKDNVNFEVDASCNVLLESEVAGLCCL